MRTICYVALVWLVTPAGAPDLAAQARPVVDLQVADDTTRISEITLRDGTTLVGWVVSIVDRVVTVRTVGGLEITVSRDDVVGVRPLSGSVREGEFWEDDLSDSRLFLGPTARVPGNGRGYVGVYELFFASGAVGLGDVAMISGGVSLLPGLDLGEQLFYIAPKVRLVNLPSLQMAAGVFWVKPGSSDESAGLVFGNVTAGGPHAAATVGVGYPFASQAGFAEEPLVMIGGELRIDRGLKLITENWVVPGEEGALLSLGLRIITRRLTVEVGAVTSTEGGALPIASFSTTW